MYNPLGSFFQGEFIPKYLLMSLALMARVINSVLHIGSKSSISNIL